jgi:hypothetical protein
MTADDFRELALELPGAEERSHMNHPDFRVGGKIFATLDAEEVWGMAKLTPEQQAGFMEAEPEVFIPAAGAWGRGGSTRILLAVADPESVRRALFAAWRNTAPKEALQRFDQA